MPLQYYFTGGVLLAFAIFAFAMYKSVKKHDARMAGMKKKKRRRR